MAPVAKTGKRARKPIEQPMARQPATEPVARVDVEESGPQIAPSTVESPRPTAGRRGVLSEPLTSATSPPRRAPTALLAGGAVGLALVALLVAWLWPSAPEPPPAPHGQDTGGQLPPPAAATPESTAAPPPSPAEVAPAAGTLPAEPVAPSVGAPPPIVETTVREPTPTAEFEAPPSAHRPTAPLLEHEGQIAQPVPLQEEPATAQPVPLQEEPSTEKVPEPAATGISAPPSASAGAHQSQADPVGCGGRRDQNQTTERGQKGANPQG